MLNVLYYPQTKVKNYHNVPPTACFVSSEYRMALVLTHGPMEEVYFPGAA